MFYSSVHYQKSILKCSVLKHIYPIYYSRLCNKCKETIFDPLHKRDCVTVPSFLFTSYSTSQPMSLKRHTSVQCLFVLSKLTRCVMFCKKCFMKLKID